MLRGASQEAYALNHDFVRTEHLLLALLRDENGPAVALLRDCGINVAAALAELVERTPPCVEEVASLNAPSPLIVTDGV